MQKIANNLPAGWRIVVGFEKIEQDVEVVVEILGPNQERFVVAVPEPDLPALLEMALDETLKRSVDKNGTPQ